MPDDDGDDDGDDEMEEDDPVAEVERVKPVEVDEDEAAPFGFGWEAGLG